MYNETTIPQLGICSVVDNHRLWKLSVVPANGPALLGMPDVEVLDILTMNCNKINTHKLSEKISKM